MFVSIRTSCLYLHIFSKVSNYQVRGTCVHSVSFVSNEVTASLLNIGFWEDYLHPLICSVHELCTPIPIGGFPSTNHCLHLQVT